MKHAESGDTVKVQYTARNIEGDVLDSSRDRAPFEFTIGAQQTIPGFENAVIGMKPGDTKTETIPASEAYGPRKPELVVAVPHDQLPEEIEPEVGQRLQVTYSDGRTKPVTVAEVTREEVVLDTNHPLAGQDLTLEIELLGIA